MIQEISPMFLAVCGCMGLLSAYIAARRGKDPYFWFFIGAIFGLLGTLTLFFLSPAKKKPKKPALIIESFIEGPAQKFWYYLDPSHQKIGPMSLAALTKAWKNGTISQTTFIWHEELSDWKPLEQCIQTREVPGPKTS